MVILITGGAGFIGSSLADKLLTEGNKLLVIDNLNDYYDLKLKKQNIVSNLDNPDYTFCEGDICDKELMAKIFAGNEIDSVVHFASLAGVRHSFKYPLEYLKNNIVGTINLLEQMRNNKVGKIVFASSSSVYGECNAEKFREDVGIENPVSPYAVSKLACEHILRAYSKSYGISAICLRLFSVYGPRQRPDLVVRKFVNLINEDKPVYVYGNGKTVRDYTYIDDIVSGICAAINYDKSLYEVINLGAGNPISLEEVIGTIEKVLGKKAKRQNLPMQRGDVYKTASDITKAYKLLNYEPKISFEDGIRNFIQWEEAQQKF